MFVLLLMSVHSVFQYKGFHSECKEMIFIRNANKKQADEMKNI